MKLVSSLLCVSLIACGGTAADPLTAHEQRITYGTVDSTGRYPSTGAMLALRDTGKVTVRCSGTLIAPTVFLTAAHCAWDKPIWVSFSPNVYAADAVHIPGRFIAHPEYRGALHNDIAVIRLERAVRIAPVQLPGAGLLSQLEQKGELDEHAYVTVGYGVTERTEAPQPVFLDPDGLRRYATSDFASMNNAMVNFSQQVRQGEGGNCFGDSGGPYFLDSSNLQVATTIAGDGVCENVGSALRMDTPLVRQFLAQFIDLP